MTPDCCPDLDRLSAGYQHKKRTQWGRHLRSKFPEQISCCDHPEADRGPLSGVRHIVKTRREICVPDKPARSCSYKI